MPFPRIQSFSNFFLDSLQKRKQGKEVPEPGSNFPRLFGPRTPRDPDNPQHLLRDPLRAGPLFRRNRKISVRFPPRSLADFENASHQSSSVDSPPLFGRHRIRRLGNRRHSDFAKMFSVFGRLDKSILHIVQLRFDDEGEAGAFEARSVESRVDQCGGYLGSAD